MFWRSRQNFGPTLAAFRAVAPIVLGGGLLVFAVAMRLIGGEPHRRSVHMLRRAILGRGKGSVLAVLGRPHAARYIAAANSSFQADTWYYPMDHRDRSAIAVTFDNGVATRVEFFRSPVS